MTELILGIAWWNTSLSPIRARHRAEEEDKQVAAGIVSSLIDSLQIDCLALGEVTSDELTYLLNSCSTQDYGIFDGTLKKESHLFDTGLIYNKSRLEIIDTGDLIDGYGSHSLKLAQRIDFKDRETSEDLHLYVSHWPRRLWCHENSAMRNNFGIRLRDSIGNFKQAGNESAQIIIMGDFNDEPFDESLAQYLLATRDRTIVMRDDKYFYNPFWRRMGEVFPFSAHGDTGNSCGTCFHKSGGEETRWRTFDQIIVSSSLLDCDRWFIDEENTNSLKNAVLDELLESKSRIFDHRPVLSYLRRRIDALVKEESHDGV
jgi:hypothetical protein